MAKEYLYGRRSVLETLRAGRRKFGDLLVAEKSKRSGPVVEIVEEAWRQGVTVEDVRRQHLDALTKGANHQGVLLECSSYPYSDLDTLFDTAKQRNEPPFFLLLDLLQDVQNVGTLLRTADAVGVHGVILQERRGANITPAVVNSSSGAVEHVHVAQVTNLVRTMETLKEADVWLTGLDQGEDAGRYDHADLSGAMGLVIGSEGQGLRRLVRESCDYIIYLPMRGRIESLNAAVAGSIALYTTWQARNFSETT